MSSRVEQEPFTDVHTFARPQDVRTSHVSLDWTIDFERKAIAGTATLTLSAPVKAGRLILDTRGLAVEAAELILPAGPRPVAFRFGTVDANLGTPLIVDVTAETTAVRIRYRTGDGASGLQWLAPEQTASKTGPYLFSQAQAINARSFIPCQDSPGLRITYDAVVRVPVGTTVVMSAENRSRSDEPGVFRFAMPIPIPPYLIAVAAGNLKFLSIGDRTGVWSEPQVVASAASEFADLEKMLEAVESMFGAYRWHRYDVLVLPPSFPFGGMENPMMTFATPTLLAGDRSLVNVIAHELAHSWSGNLVTNATWRDFWLNEGFTVYLERRIVERVYGTRTATQESILGKSSLQSTFEELKGQPKDTRLYIDLEGRDPDDGMTDVAYEKGALFLTMLERTVGRERFDAFLRSWFDEHAFQSVTTPQFERFLTERLFGGDAAAMASIRVREWLYDELLPPNVPAFDEGVFAAPATAAADFIAGRRAAAELDTKAWNTAEWLHFLEKLPETLDASRLAELDRALGFTSRGNAEVAASWLQCAIRARYEAAYPRLEEFLISIGRRKFLKPLYTELVKTPDGLAMARRIYSKARPGYHPISQQTVDKLLGLP